MSLEKGDRVICWHQTNSPSPGTVVALNCPRKDYFGVLWDSIAEQGRKHFFCYHISTLKKEQQNAPTSL